MLVSAFAGYRHTMNAYREAVAQQYRFSATAMRCSLPVILRHRMKSRRLISRRSGGAVILTVHQTVSLVLMHLSFYRMRVNLY